MLSFTWMALSRVTLFRGSRPLSWPSLLAGAEACARATAAEDAACWAAHSRFFARSRPPGHAARTTCRANAAAGGGTDEGRHRAM